MGCLEKHLAKKASRANQAGKTDKQISKVNKSTVKYENIVFGGLLGLTFFSGTLLTLPSTSADVVDVVTITVPVSCSIASTGEDSHNAEIANGIYTPNIGTTTLHAFCNDNNGFAIYAAGYTGNEIGGENSNKLVGTSASNNVTIASGTATTAGNPDISNWAMKLTKTQDSGDTTGTNALTIDSAPNVDLPSQAEQTATSVPFSNYHVIPNEYVKVAHKDSATDMTESTGGVKLTTTYAAYISKTQPADTYTGQVKYTLVHPANHAASVAYNTNADDISEVTYLQEFGVVNSTNRAAIVESMVPETQYTATDARDGKTYTIAKYQAGTDSNTNQPIYDVWMTKNLDLEIEAGRTYTNEDTDLGYNTATGEYSTSSWTPIRGTYVPTTTHTHAWCQGGTWNSEYDDCESNDTPESYDPGNLYWNLTESDHSDWEAYYDSCDHSTSTPVCDESLNPISTYVSSTGTNQYHLGNYYNWAAALASNNSSTFNNSEVVEQSICPTGWTLPRVGYGEDTFYSLWNQYGFSESSINGSNKLWASPLYFVAGGYYGGSLFGVGLDGYFWSAVADGELDAGDAIFNVDGYVSPSGGGYRYYGNSIRCIARPVVESL